MIPLTHRQEAGKLFNDRVTAEHETISDLVKKDKNLTGPQRHGAIREQFTGLFQLLRDRHFASDEYKGLEQFLACNQDTDRATQHSFNFFLAASVEYKYQSKTVKSLLSEREWLDLLRREKLPLNPV
jgi:hypothetical protein